MFAAGSTWFDLTPNRQQVAADPASEAWLPDELFRPSPWLRSTTDRDGPPGRLIAVVPGEHKSLFSSQQGFYGVSAETGEYRFLNLLDIAQAEAIRPVSGRDQGGLLAGKPTDEWFSDGFAVYDDSTGERLRESIESRFGLVGEGFGWTQDTVWVQYSELTKPPTKSGWSANQAPTLIKNLVDQTTSADPVGSLDLSGSTSGSAGLVVKPSPGFHGGGSHGPERTHPLSGNDQVNPSPVLSTDGTKVAGLRSSNVSGDRRAAGAGHVPTDGTRVVMTELSGVKGFQVFGWQDDSHVMGIFARKPTC